MGPVGFIPYADMERAGGSIRHVPSPLPKGLRGRRRLSGPASTSVMTGGGGMISGAVGNVGPADVAERDAFERGQTVSINKAINAQEVAVKEKHARTCILGTHHEKGAHTFWSVVNRLPLSSNAVLCWKFCHVFHKLLRDGHPNVLKDSVRYKSELSDMSRMWGHLSEGYGQLCSIYLKLLRIKMEFHTKNPRFPGNLQMSDRQLDETGENDVNNFFQLTVEMFDYLECELNLFQTVFSSLDMSRSVSVTSAGQCRLAPLIQVILDCSHLYDYTVKLLFKLHSCLPADTLQGHRDRFLEQFKKEALTPSEQVHNLGVLLDCLSNVVDVARKTFAQLDYCNTIFMGLLMKTTQKLQQAQNIAAWVIMGVPRLKDLFYRSSNLQYFKRLIQIPQLPENPPNFLRASALSEHISPVVVIPVEASSPDSEPIMDLVEMETSSQKSLFDNKFDDIFGSSFSNDPFNFNSQNGMTKDDKDRIIEQLHTEIDTLKDELRNFKAESHQLMMQLKGRISELEAEFEEQKHLKQQALDESDFLRTELDELKKRQEDREKTQRSLTEIERKAQATEQRYMKLKDKYSELVQNHADLLRKNAEVTKQVTVARQVQGDTERDKKELEDSLQQLSEQAQRKTQEQAEILETLRRELTASKQELQYLRSTLDSSVQSEEEHTTHLAVLQQERDTLTEAVAQHDQQMAALEAEVQQLKATLEREKEKSSKVMQELQSRLGQTENNAQALQQQFLDKQFSFLQGAVKEAEQMVEDALNQLDDPTHISSTSSADYLLTRTLAASECVKQLQKACGQYCSDQSDVSSLLSCVPLFAHLIGDAILQASATSHMAPMETADLLLETCKQCGSETLCYLRMLKDKASLERADCSAVGNCLSQITAIAEELRPKGLDVDQEKLGDLVDEEMAATAAAIETAVARIEEMLSKSRAGDTGAKLEVNERILGSCTGLMQAIHVLVLASKDLQREIVESGRGAATPKEFYARNSRWTEGLISASKAVGWGATVMVDAADLVVQGNGKFEELMVCSHEIAASTAQLVASSKVKADKDSVNLSKLQLASRGVNQATARVVASTKSGKSQIQEKDSMDFSDMTLTQIKRQEMDSQVRVLELESQLQKERQRLGELRKKHYELGGVAEGWDENGAELAP